MPVLFGIAVSLGAWQLVLAAENRAIRAHFEVHSTELAMAIQHQLANDVSAVESVAAVFATSQEVKREDFHTVTSHLLARHRSLRALGWNPRVRRTERRAFEAAARRAGLRGYQITERSESGAMVPATDRPEHYVVHYIEPHAGNEAALGYDVGSESRRRAALERAAATGQPTLTAGISLVQDERDQGFLFFWPLYRRGAPIENPAQRREHLEGFVVGVFQVTDVLEAAMQGFDAQAMDTWVEDVTEPASATLLYSSRVPTIEGAQERSHAPSANPVGPIRSEHVTIFEKGGRKWRLSFTPTARELAAQRTWFPLTTLLAGLVITGLCSVYLNVLQRRARSIAELAGQRGREIAHRERVEEVRRRLDAKLQQAQKLESLGVLAGGIAHDFNNLLTGILGNADLALMELSPESPGREELAQIRLTSTRAADRDGPPPPVFDLQEGGAPL
jgi:CHASE1-domain containing sensor protein